MIGGVAASLVGKPRATQDIDGVIWLADERGLDELLESGRSCGFEPRIPDVVPFARANRVLLLIHRPSGVGIDLSLAVLPFERQMLDHATSVHLGEGFALPVPAPADLVVMKIIARRPKDIADIEHVLEANPDVDRAHVRRWVKQFAEVLESPEILDDLERIFKRVPAE